MKRTLTLLAILAAIGPAWGAEVVSSNIVGYNKVELSGGFTIIGSQFNLVGADTKDVQDFIDPSNDLPGLDAENSYAAQTELQVWTGTGYRTYGWDPDGDPDVAGSDHKWVDEDLAVADVDILIGKGFWIKTPVAGKVTISK